MKSILFIFICSLLVAVSCIDRPTAPNGSVIMPLAVNNKWIGEWTTYSDTDSTTFAQDTLLSITGTAVMDGDLWYVTNTGERLINKPDGLYTVMHSDTGGCTCRRIKALYPAMVGDTFNTVPPAYFLWPGETEPVKQIVADQVGSRDTLIILSSGVYKCYHYHPEMFAPVDARFITEQHWFYAPDIGPVLILQYDGGVLAKKWELRQYILH